MMDRYTYEMENGVRAIVGQHSFRAELVLWHVGIDDVMDTLGGAILEPLEPLCERLTVLVDRFALMDLGLLEDPNV